MTPEQTLGFILVSSPAKWGQQGPHCREAAVEPRARGPELMAVDFSPFLCLSL